MKIIATALPEVKIIETRAFGDERGFVLESFQLQRYKEAGIDLPFVQDNLSHSQHGVLRGLHYQLKHPQGKLITVINGEIFDVAVDIRYGSPTFGNWVGAILSDENHHQLYLPPGFAHGFCVLSKNADVLYKCTDYYIPNDDYGIIWNDSTIGVKWPLKIKPVLSAKDSAFKILQDIPRKLLPQL